MKCPRCAHDNESSAKFCEECATALALACAKCGRHLSATAKFCPECANPVRPAAALPSGTRFGSPESYTPTHLAERILTSRAALEGERKHVTVLFADVKGSMELLGDRDPEEARKILDPVLERMMKAVHHYEGTVNQVMGDGIMALFGAPLAHEDHAVRACYAALRMQDAVRRYSDELRRGQGVEVQVRIGINSGEVVVRSIGSDLRMDYSAVGQTTNLAARMEQLAAPGSIRLTAETLQLAEGFVQVRPLGPVPVKGLAGPVEVFELAGAGEARTRLEIAVRRGLSRFVGRDAEMEQLRRATEEVRGGRGQLVAVVGEPGVGKSRLYHEFIHSHHTHGWLTLESGSVSYGKASAYLPLADLLRGYFRIETRDDVRAIRAKVTGNLLTLDEGLKDAIPPVLWLLDALPEDSPLLALEPAERRRRTLAAVKTVLLRESRVQPLLIVFEDLHWIDSETQAFLDALVEGLPAVSILLAVNYRPEYRHGWGSKTYYRQLRIDALPPESAEELLAALLGTDPSVSPLKPLLIARTEGNPLFLEESVRTLVEIGALTGSGGAYRLTRPPDAISMPPTVQAILAARIDRLGPEDKRLLQAAAVVGKDVPFALLLAVADLDEDGLRQGLARLQATEFLYEIRLFPELEYTFKHALTHEVAYNSLLGDRRRALHGVLLDALERLYSDRLDEHVEELAHHARRAGLREEAIRYVRRAGDRAAARSAHREAIAFAEQALTLLGEGPETTETMQLTVDVRIAHASSLVPLVGFGSAEIETPVGHAHDLASRLGDPARFFTALWWRWFISYGRGRFPEALEIGERLLEVAEEDHDRVHLLEAHHSLWATLGAMGQALRAVPHCERGIALYRPSPSQNFPYGGHDPGACCGNHLARARWSLGYPEQATSAIRDALRRIEKQAHPLSMVLGLSTEAFLAYQQGDHAAARETAEQIVAIANVHELTSWIDDGLVILACLRARDQRDQRALDKFCEQLPTRSGTSFRKVVNLILLADVLSEAGDVDRGLAILDAIPPDHRNIILASEIRRIRGDLLLRRDETDEGERLLREAIDVARQRSQRMLELRATTSLARLWQRQGRRHEAARMLREIYGWFTEGFDTPDLRAAKALLADL
jgi:class 3 adenylate cyclase/predicted negative regulator of RcsB-dependent stress response